MNNIIDIDIWMAELMEKTQEEFKDRLLFLGLQGSYRRSEAHEDSDIDAVVILDTLSLDDLKIYREILSTMPANEKSCGFISGRSEIANWPRHELFQFKRDTRAYYGGLDALLPTINKTDIRFSIKVEASSLYHACSHALVHHPQDINALKAMYKSAYFILLAINYLKSEVYAATKTELLKMLCDDEYEILYISMHWESEQENILANPDEYYNMLLRWTQMVLSNPNK